MERYKEYKDSGISWLGKIPYHWEVARMKRVFSEAKEKTSTEEGTLLSLSQYTGITLKEDAKKVGMFEAESTIGYNVVHPGQFVMNIMLAWNGSYAVSDYEGIISPSYCVFNFKEKCERKYFHYLLRLPSYAGAFKTMSKGIIESRLRLYPIYFFAFNTIIPPLKEQEKIVNYIEKKTSKIDAYIAEKEKEVQLLKELKEAEIAKVVTQGLNPNVKMKESGISWIGMIPEHWEQYRFATICHEKSICDCVNEELLSVYLDRGVIRFSDDTNKRTNPTSKDLTKYQLVEEGDLVLNNQQAWRGSVGVSNYRGIVSPAYFIFSLSPLIHKEFANYLFRSKPSVSYYYMCSKGIGSIQRNLDWGTLKQKKIALPSIAEQQSIVDYINEKCSKINSLVSELESEIDYLKEYKQRLIADCVTGQVNVQNIEYYA